VAKAAKGEDMKIIIVFILVMFGLKVAEKILWLFMSQEDRNRCQRYEREARERLRRERIEELSRYHQPSAVPRR